MGAGWVPPEQRKPVAQSVAQPLAQPAVATAHDVSADPALEDAITGRVMKVEPQMPDTFNFNDLFGGPKNQGPMDRPSA